jgi:hypothetical protein
VTALASDASTFFCSSARLGSTVLASCTARRVRVVVVVVVEEEEEVVAVVKGCQH